MAIPSNMSADFRDTTDAEGWRRPTFPWSERLTLLVSVSILCCGAIGLDLLERPSVGSSVEPALPQTQADPLGSRRSVRDVGTDSAGQTVSKSEGPASEKAYWPGLLLDPRTLVSRPNTFAQMGVQTATLETGSARTWISAPSDEGRSAFVPRPTIEVDQAGPPVAPLAPDQTMGTIPNPVRSEGVTAPTRLAALTDAPVPTPRPHDLQAPFRRASAPVPQRREARSDLPPPRSAVPDDRNFLERFLGFPTQASVPKLAYAAPDNGLFTGWRSASSNALSSDDATAIYDISAHSVVLPDGSVLEAHSGLGTMLDDPSSVSTRDRGAIPPQVYSLTLRESLFHGVQALRLTPAGRGSVYGRDGFLAHTYMLGPRGDSNGCISFKNYPAFLQAYRQGQIKRLIVVAQR